MKRIEVDEHLERILAEFAGLCNQIITADVKRKRSRSDLKPVVRKVCGYIGIGLERLKENVAVAGDGLAFDEEGNLYAVFSGITLDRRLGRLLRSGVFVYTPDGRFNEFFTVRMPRDIITNIAFGLEPFDPHSLYCYGFTDRLYRVEVGIRGRLLP